MARFTEEEMLHLVAYQRLYGPLTPDRLDMVIARLGMDVAAPHMKKGARPKLRDHLMEWSRTSRPRRTGRELRAVLQQMQAAYEGKTSASRSRRRSREEPPLH